MAPPLFADVSKTTNDLFVKDYKDFSGKVEISSKLKSGVSLKGIFTRADKDGAISSTLEAKKVIAGTDCTLKLGTANDVTLIAEHGALFPNLKLKAEKTLAGAPTITAEYKVESYAGSAALDAAKQTATLSAVAKLQGALLGVSSTYDYNKAVLTSPTVKAQYNGSNYEVGASVENGGEKLGLAFYQSVRSDLSLAANLESTSKGQSLAAGAAYSLGKGTTLRGRLDSAGVLSFLYTQKIRPEVTVKAVGQLDALKLSTPKLGVSVLVGL